MGKRLVSPVDESRKVILGEIFFVSPQKIISYWSETMRDRS